METRNHNLMFLLVIVVFSAVSSMAIVEVLVTGEARADSVNFTVRKDLPLAVVLDPNNANAYVVNLHDNTLSLISGQTKTVIGSTAMIGKYPAVVTFSSASDRNMYVVNLHDNTLSLISGQTKTVIGNLIFVKNSAGETTFGYTSPKSYNIETVHKVPLSGVASTKVSSKVEVNISSPGTSSAGTITTSSSKGVATPSHPPLIP